MKAACGPPAPMGMPKRWVVPTTMSAPHSPGGVIRVSASRSVATMKAACFAWALSTSARRSSVRPLVAGYWAMDGDEAALLTQFHYANRVIHLAPSLVALGHTPLHTLRAF